MDIATIFGIIIGFTVVLGSSNFNTDILGMIFQPTAALIVIGGTFAAAFINFPMSVIDNAFISVYKNLLKKPRNAQDTVVKLNQIANFARVNGILALQNVLEQIEDKFLKKSLSLAIDINNPEIVKNILINEIELEEEKSLMNIRVFEALGGYAPTFGIIGAVLGLIQVMGNIDEPSILGHGIAVAFVATLYGVGLANLVFLPIAGKLKVLLADEMMFKRMLLEGIISVISAESPFITEEKLISYSKCLHKRENCLIKAWEATRIN